MGYIMIGIYLLGGTLLLFRGFDEAQLSPMFGFFVMMVGLGMLAVGVTLAKIKF